MNPYTIFGATTVSGDATPLSERLATWHDAMVAHNRRLRAGRPDEDCDEECPHGEARALWAEAVRTFGSRAHELSFLRSSATAGAVRKPASRQAAVMRQPVGVAAGSLET